MLFKPIAVEVALPQLKKYYKTLNGGCDDYVEEAIMDGKLFQLMEGDTVVGVIAINKNNKLTCLYVEEAWLPKYNEIFDQAILFGKIEGVFTVTADTRMMNQLLRKNFDIKKQAYNFWYKGDRQETTIDFRKAELSDLDLMEPAFGDFFDNYEKKIKQGDLYLGYDQGELVSLGNRTMHRLQEKTASIGMIVKEEHREKGYGTQTIKSLINVCIDNGWEVHAGCWFYNHASRKTLLKAGMHTSNLIIRVDEM